MKIEMKCFADLAKHNTCDYATVTIMEMSEGASAQDLMRAAGIGPQEVKLVFVNGRVRGPGHLLKDGDRVALAPATGGM
jgi:molybdopterin converting factor small subunit